jgi:catechol 2,3-dioxygenase
VNPEINVRPYGVAPPASTLPDATTLGPVHLQVSDLTRSLEYYQRIIGLRAEKTADDTSVLTAHGDDRALVVLHSRPGVTPARRGAFGLYHFALLLPERAALGRLAAHLAAHHIRVGMADHLVSEALYLSDPDGLGIEIYADRPRVTWQHRDRELAMTTEPLDIASVIAEGRGERWDGAPTGTTMGHVHLHVGNLDDAEAFYHRALGFDKTVWSYPGALFLSAGGYHHHLGTNVWAPGPAPTADQARLLEWTLVVPTEHEARVIGERLRNTAAAVVEKGADWLVTDPWGTRLRISPERGFK